MIVIGRVVTVGGEKKRHENEWRMVRKTERVIDLNPESTGAKAWEELTMISPEQR